MTPEELIQATRIRHDEKYYGDYIAKNGFAVFRGNRLLNCFENEKDAMAWSHHIYHNFSRDINSWNIKEYGLELKRLGDLPIVAGWQIVYDGNAEFSAVTACQDGFKTTYEKAGFGLLVCQDPIMVHFNPYGIWYQTCTGFSASGGPAVSIKPQNSCTLIGLKKVKVQMWSDGMPRESNAGVFEITMPLARWNGVYN